jgi:lysophospholipase L1-like esterase
MKQFVMIIILVAATIGLITVNNPADKQDSGTLPESNPLSAAEPLAENGIIKPVSLTSYPPEAPAPNIPVVKWTIPIGSVYFEIEFLTDLPENPNGTSPSQYRFFASQSIYTNGYSVNLAAYPKDHLYWRVRGIGLDAVPVGVFSDAVPLYIDHNLPQILKPESNTGYKAVNMPMPLYPSYAWIPIYGAAAYELEVTLGPPENPNGIQSSQSRVRAYTIKGSYDYHYCYYDEVALGTPGTYYWRVRGMDKSGRPVGVFSDAEEFKVSYAAGNYAATYGDSTTHGGGDMIYAPAHVACNYQTYLSFPTMNLARSADNAAAMLERFDRDVLPFQPQYLIILGGIPDTIDAVPASKIIEELAGIRDKCTQNGIRPIFLTLYPVNPAHIKRTANRDSASNWQEKLATVNAFLRKQKYCIDIEPYFQGPDGVLPEKWSIDGIHLGVEGKKQMARVINENWVRVTQ